MPAVFSPEVAETVCAGLREGKTMIVIAAELKVHRNTIYDWMRKHPLFQRDCSLARAEGAHALIDESLHIADCPLLDPQRARNMIAARQWAAERRNKKEYSPHIEMTVEQLDLGGTLLEARKRLALPGSSLQLPAPVQDVEYVQIPDRSAADTQSSAPVPFVNPFD